MNELPKYILPKKQDLRGKTVVFQRFGKLDNSELYDLEEIEKIFLRNSEEYEKRLKEQKYWTYDTYQPDRFNLSQALFLMVQEIIKLRKGMSITLDNSKFWRDKAAEYEWMYEEQRKISEEYRKILEALRSDKTKSKDVKKKLE